MRWIQLLSALHAFGHRLRRLGRRQEARDDVAEELAFHRAQLARDFTHAGLDGDEARRLAAARVGSTTRWLDEAADAWRFGSLESALTDVRFTWRQWRRAPGLVAVSLASIALGVGANAGLFAVLNAVAFRPLPVRAPAELRLINIDDDVSGSYMPWPLVQELRAAMPRAFAVAAEARLRDLSLERQGVATLTPRGGSLVSGNYFELLGVQPAAGRLLRASDEDEGSGDHLAVLSHAFWQSAFGGDAAIVGQVVRFNGVPMQVIGVAPARFLGTQPGVAPDAWFPITADDALLHRAADWRRERTNWWVQAIGRQQVPDAGAAVSARLTRVVRDFRTALDGPDASAEARARVAAIRVSLADGRSGLGGLRHAYARPLRLLWGLSLLVLVIAAVNVATLLAGRLHARAHEFSVRTALGASRPRLLRQVMVEGLLLGVAGSALALALLMWGGAALRTFLFPAARRVLLDFTLDGRVLAGGALALVVTVLLLALVPAFLLARHSNSTMRVRQDGTRGGRGWGGQVLGALQCGLALPLLVAAALLGRSFMALRDIPVGFSGDDVTMVRLDATRNDRGPSARVATYERVAGAVRALPGVRAVSSTRNPPLSGSWSGNTFTVEGSRAPTADERSANTQVHYVDPGYFRTMGAPLLAGREFTADDAPRQRHVAVVSETFARTHFGSAAGALGRRMARGSGDAAPFTIEIVGVTADARLTTPRQESPAVVYQPYLADSMNVALLTLLVAADRQGEALTPALTRAIQSVDPTLEVLGVTGFREHLANERSFERTTMRLTLLFGGLALLLAALGVYGVFAHDVARRRHEIGVRLALGASPAGIRTWIGRRVGQVALAGILVGVPLTVAAVRGARGLLYGVGPLDPVSHGGAALVLLAGLGLAAWRSARRADGVDPLTVLRGS